MGRLFRYLYIFIFLHQVTSAHDIQVLSEQYRAYFHNWEGFVRYLNESIPDDLPPVAIIDSAFALHPLYEDEIEYIKLSVDGSLNKDHGTHVAGIVSTVTGGRVPLILIEVGPEPDAWNLALSIKEAVDRGAKVINCSWTGPSSQFIEEAIGYARDNGVIMVFSAGNRHQPQGSYPAPLNEKFENLIIVGSVGEDGSLSHFSNYGRWVNIYAPGEDILSSVGDGFASYSGTSMSAPFISALLAIMLGIDESLSMKELKDLLLKSTYPLNDACHMYEGLITGGMIDPYLCLLSTEFYSHLKARSLEVADFKDLFAPYVNSIDLAPLFVKIAIATAIGNLPLQFSPAYVKEHEEFFSSLGPYLSIDYLVSLAEDIDGETVVNLVSRLSPLQLFEFIRKYNFDPKSFENLPSPNEKSVALFKVGFLLKENRWGQLYEVMREMDIRERIGFLNVLAYRYRMNRAFWDWASQLLEDVNDILLLKYGNWILINHLFSCDENFAEILRDRPQEERIMLLEKLIHTIPEQIFDFSLALKEEVLFTHISYGGLGYLEGAGNWNTLQEVPIYESHPHLCLQVLIAF